MDNCSYLTIKYYFKGLPCMTLLNFHRHLQLQPLFQFVLGDINFKLKVPVFLSSMIQSNVQDVHHVSETRLKFSTEKIWPYKVLMCVLFSTQLFSHRPSFWIYPKKFAPCGQKLGFGLAYPNLPWITSLELSPLIHPRSRPLKCLLHGANYRQLLVWLSLYLL